MDHCLTRRSVLALAGVAALPAARAGVDTLVERTYAAAGRLEVAARDVDDEDTGARLYRVYAPVAGTARLPIVTWGNGTGSGPATYEGLLRHLASWGFAVIDSARPNVGDGRPQLDAAAWLVAQDTTPGSPFEGRIATDRIGAAGTSQGAVGTINAATAWPDSAGVVCIAPDALPAPGDGKLGYDASLVRVPMFLIGGTRDKLISPLHVNVAAFDATPADLPAMRAMRRGAGHTEIEGDGGGDRGYLTAWLRCQLAADPFAALAFLGGPAAEVARNPGWANVEAKNLR